MATHSSSGILLPGEFHGQRSHGISESDMTEQQQLTLSQIHQYIFYFCFPCTCFHFYSADTHWTSSKHETCRKPRQKCPPRPPKAARNPHELHPTLDLSLRPQRRPKNSLLARQQALPLHPGVPLPRDSIVENPPRHPPPGQATGL